WIFVLVVYIARVVVSFPQFQSQIPNGQNVPHPCNDKAWSAVGHANPNGGHERNPFGNDFAALGMTWNEALCRADSDGDGMSNGEELGDPNCTRSQGQPFPSTPVSHPGVCEPLGDEKCKGKNDWLNCKRSDFECDTLNDPETQYFDIKFPRRKVPAKKTTYTCMVVEVPEVGDHHMVANTPLIDNDHVMHHMLLYGCQGDAVPKLNTPYECGMEASLECRELIGLWQVGLQGECMHRDAGFRFGKNGYRHIALQMHWTNKQERSDYRDGSGMRIFYTTSLRQHDAGTLWVGQMFLEIPPQMPDVAVSGVCTSECTSKIFEDNLNVIGAFNHMHLLGKGQNVEHFRNGKRIGVLTNDTHYSYNSPAQKSFDVPIVVKPGDELKTTCTFNSEGVRKYTFFGKGTHDEMCFAFIKYYPKQKAKIQKCLSFRELSMCPMFPETADLFDDGVKGCNIPKFTSLTNPATLAIVFQIQAKCRPDICTQECKDTIRKLRQHPCLKEDIWEYLKFFLMAEKRGDSGIDVEKLLVLYSVCDLQLGREMGRDVIVGTTTMRMSPEDPKDKLMTTVSTGSTKPPSCPQCPPTHLSICNRSSALTNTFSFVAMIL
ncbi:uncharacterized protein LOC134244942, partial [Saccostrea cucullata]|uniref:uncharacterized protein LOC134244942 n=1 Tax=Saccostrea cuccullata TaxID=36930 RepID=UPI002ECFBDE1